MSGKHSHESRTGSEKWRREFSDALFSLCFSNNNGGMRGVLALLATAVALVAAGANSCDGVPNTLPITAAVSGSFAIQQTVVVSAALIDTDSTTFIQVPQFVGSVPNGKMYTAQAQEGNNITVVHLYGTPYEWGLAQGQLLKSSFVTMIPAFYQYLDSQIAPEIKNLPKWIQVRFGRI